jgi:hypothetical protein
LAEFVCRNEEGVGNSTAKVSVSVDEELRHCAVFPNTQRITTPVEFVEGRREDNMAAVRPLSPPSPSTTATTLAIQTSLQSLTSHSNTISFPSIPSPTIPTRPRQQSTISNTNTNLTTGTESTPPGINGGPLIVRALYDYHSPDTSNLSFQAGTLIRVITQLPTGWWDGCIDGERGWFPRNFVTEVDIDDLAFGDEEEDFLDMNESTDEDDDTSGDESDGERALAEDTGVHGVSEDLMTAEEFTWVPHADKEGRTFYLNTQNGTTSWELPGTKIYLDDWDESRMSDEDGGGQPRSSLDSENSDVLMLGPIKPELNLPDFKEFNVSSLFLLHTKFLATLYSIRFLKTFLPFQNKFNRLF